jgi:glypican 5
MDFPSFSASFSLVLTVLVLTAHASSKTQCGKVQNHFVKNNIGQASLVPENKIHDPNMEICYRGSKELERTSCCSRKMERKYVQAADKDFYEVIRSTSSYLKKLLSINVAQYRDNYVALIQSAENSTELLFSNVYKIPLKDRRGPIDALFMDMQAYLKRREVNIHDSMDQFFDDLFPLVFHHILNDPTVTDLSDTYRECLMGVRQTLYPKPFGEVPNRLAHQLSKSLIAGKTFLEALDLGIETINTTDHMTLEQPCVKSLARLRYCSHCDGFIEARPCRNFCYNVMRGCLATISEIDRHWNEFVDSIKAVTVNMKGYYNMENLLHNLDSRISEAILHAMETGHKFYPQVVEKCGHPKAMSEEKALSVAKMAKVDASAAAKKSAKKTTGQQKKNYNLYSRIETFMRSLMASKGFYRSLADTMCSAEKFATGTDQEQCWNGNGLGKYNKTLVDIDLESQMTSNPEMRVAARQPTTTITKLIDKLIHIKKLLNSKVTSEKMQSDDYNRNYGNKKQKGRRGSRRGGEGSGGWDSDRDGGYYGHMDDEDYTDESSGSGHYPAGSYPHAEGSEGSGGGYHTYQPVYNKKHKPNRKPNNNGDPDIYLEDEKPSPAPDNSFTRRAPSADQSRSGNMAPSRGASIALTLAAIATLYTLLING